MTSVIHIAELTSPQFDRLVQAGNLVVLLPVGSVEPHGPHMMLATDTVISIGAIKRATKALRNAGYQPALAPSIPYGVTECAAAFPGAISVAPQVLSNFIAAVIGGYLGQGAIHVCVVNNHLEPDQDRAVREGVSRHPSQAASVACPLERRWARTLSAEFKSGACHAGCYETSLMLAERPSGVDEKICRQLSKNEISLSAALKVGVCDFAEMGLTQAYSGNPAAASREAGELQYERLAAMISTTVIEALLTR